MRTNMFEIKYFLILEDENKDLYSHFCGFGKNLLKAGKAVQKIIEMPKNIFDIGLTKSQRLQRYLNSSPTGHCITPANYASFLSISDLRIPFCAIVYDSTIHVEIQNKIKNWTFKPVLLDISLDWNDTLFLGFIEMLEDMKRRDAKLAVLQKEMRDISEKNFVISEPVSKHGVVSPIINILNLYGVKFTNVKQFITSNENSDFVKIICELNRSVLNIAKSIDKDYHSFFDCIFAVAPLYPKYALNKYFQHIDNKELSKAIQSFIMQKDYIICAKDEVRPESIVAVSIERQAEINFFYLCMSLVYEKYFSPLIRVAQGVQTDINMEVQALLHSDKNKKGLLFKNFIHKIEKYVDSAFLDFLPTDIIPRVKIYSDAPIEFCRYKKNGLPLSIGTKYCKIPTTPGNVFFSSVANNTEIFLTYAELQKVLVIRSFKECDEIKPLLEDALNKYKKEDDFNLNVIFEDAKCVQDVISIRKKHSDANIIIFDCHAHQASKEPFGNLIIGDERFNIWEHGADFLPPPIVLFSACETFPLGNVFNSVANGFLQAGVISAIATNSPVSAFESSIFISRLLFRISFLLSNLLSNENSISWLDLVSDFFRMSFKTDVINYFIKRNFITDVQKIMEMDFLSNCDINCENPNWYENFLLSLANESGFTEEKCRNIISRDVNFSETMKYVLLGNADSIIIHR